MFTCPCFPLRIHKSSGGGSGDLLSGCFFCSDSGRSLSLLLEEFRESWWTKVSVDRSLSPARRFHPFNRFSASSQFLLCFPSNDVLKVEDLLTSVRTGEKKEKVCNVFTSHPVSERGGGGKEEEGVLSPLVSDMRQPKVDFTNAFY